jgi:hypothetical protein
MPAVLDRYQIARFGNVPERKALSVVRAGNTGEPSRATISENEPSRERAEIKSARKR